MIVMLVFSITAVAQDFSGGESMSALSDESPYYGMGRVILEKRLTDNKKQPILKQNDFHQSNTVYIVKYDFVLGENITIPKGCILKFQGGSINGNKTIKGQCTELNAGLLRIFGKDITLEGTWNVLEVFPEWFGVADKGNTDDGVAISKAISMGKTVVLSNRYYVKSTITIESPIDIVGRNHGTVVYKGESKCFVLNGPRIRLSDFNIFGAADANHIRTTTCAIYMGLEKAPSARECRIDNLNIRYFGVGIETHNTWIDRFFNVSSRQNTIGVKIGNVSNDIIFNSCDIDANLTKGVLLDTRQGINVVFDNCCIEGNQNNIRDTPESIYEKISFRGCYFEEIARNYDNYFFELKGRGVVSIFDCASAGVYNSFFGSKIKLLCDSSPVRFRCESPTSLCFSYAVDIACLSHPVFSGNVISFSRTVNENGFYCSYNNPTIRSKKDLSDYICNEDVGIYNDLSNGINIYRWLVLDFLFDENITDKEIAKMRMFFTFYKDDSKKMKIGVVGIDGPGSETMKAKFIMKNKSARRFQYYAYLPAVIKESDLDKIGFFNIKSNVKIKLLNIAFCD